MASGVEYQWQYCGHEIDIVWTGMFVGRLVIDSCDRSGLGGRVDDARRNGKGYTIVCGVFGSVGSVDFVDDECDRDFVRDDWRRGIYGGCGETGMGE